MDPIVGDIMLREEARRGEVFYSLLPTRRRYILDHHGEHVLKEVAAGLGGDARLFLMEEPIPFAWYPMGPLMDLDRVVIEKAMDGQVEKMQVFASEIAGNDLSTLLKAYLWFAGNPAKVLSRLDKAYSKYFRPSIAHTEYVGDGEARVSVTGGVLPYYLCRYGVTGWVLKAVRLAGGKDVEVQHHLCRHRGDDRCSWLIRWK